jgi:2-methylcitrate dehydratase PrpD
MPLALFSVRWRAIIIKRPQPGLIAPGHQIVCVPQQVRIAPSTIVEAQCGIPCAVAAARTDGALGMSHFSDEGPKRADIRELALRVRPHVAAQVDCVWSRFVTPATVIVECRDGRSAKARVDYSKGHPSIITTAAEFTATTPGLHDVRHKAVAVRHGGQPYRDGRSARKRVR